MSSPMTPPDRCPACGFAGSKTATSGAVFNGYQRCYRCDVMWREHELRQAREALKTMVEGFYALSVAVAFPLIAFCDGNDHGGAEVTDNHGRAIVSFPMDEEGECDEKARDVCTKANAAAAICGADGNEMSPVVGAATRVSEVDDDAD